MSSILRRCFPSAKGRRRLPISTSCFHRQQIQSQNLSYLGFGPPTAIARYIVAKVKDRGTSSLRHPRSTLGRSWSMNPLLLNSIGYRICILWRQQRTSPSGVSPNLVLRTRYSLQLTVWMTQLWASSLPYVSFLTDAHFYSHQAFSWLSLNWLVRS